MKSFVAIVFAFASAIGLHAQGYIVPNGVVYAGDTGFAGFEINVIRDPTNTLSTGFFLKPTGKTLPTVFTNTFAFDAYLDVSVRVFLVASNQPVSLSPILEHTYTELELLNLYIFDHGIPFYLGLYTGNQNFYPPDGIYSDPLFGWARLVNNQGVIHLLDSALTYKAGGIYAGTLDLIPVPEPTVLTIFLAGAIGLWLQRKRLPAE